MRAEVIQAVRDLAREQRSRFRASYVAERAGVPIDHARRDLVALSRLGEVSMNFELLCPWDYTTIATFGAREEIPTVFTDEACGGGEEFEVTPELIWVTFTPTDALRAEVAADAEDVEDPTTEGGEPPGNRRSPRRGRRARASIGSPTSPARPKLHSS